MAAMTAKRKAATKRWQLAGAAKRKTAALKHGYIKLNVQLRTLRKRTGGNYSNATKEKISRAASTLARKGAWPLTKSDLNKYSSKMRARKVNINRAY